MATDPHTLPVNNIYTRCAPGQGGNAKQVRLASAPPQVSKLLPLILGYVRAPEAVQPGTARWLSIWAMCSSRCSAT